MIVNNKALPEIPEIYSIENEIILTRIDRRLSANRLNNMLEAYFSTHDGLAVIFLLLDEGSIDITINNKVMHARADGDNLIGKGMFDIINHLSCSNDVSGRILFMSKLFLDKTMRGRRILSVSQLMGMREKHTKELSRKDTLILEGCLDAVENHLADEDHLFGVDLARLAVLTFMYENMNIILSRSRMTAEHIVSNRKEDLVKRFMELLMVNIEEHHDVAFYAGMLCISPHYLSKVMKEVLNKSVGQVINDMLLERAVVLLRDSDSTAQQVADRLHFSDASSFSKFFRRRMGISPIRFKKKM